MHREDVVIADDRDAARLDPQLRSMLRDRLETERSALMERLREVSDPLERVQPGAADATATDEGEREVTSVLDAQAEAHLEAVRASLQRLERGTFGRCIDCNHDIGVERLVALPHAPRCLDCQTQAEHQRP